MEKDIQPLLHLLTDTLRKLQEKKASYETRASIVLGFAVSIFAFFVESITKGGEVKISSIIFTLVFFITTLLCLLTIRPFWFLRKRNQEESILYEERIKELGEEGYLKKISELTDNDEGIIGEYVKEIYNTANYAVLPRKKIFHTIVPILILGLIIGFLFYIFWDNNIFILQINF